MDIGGTFTKSAIIDQEGKIRTTDKIETPKDAAALYALIDHLLKTTAVSFSGVGISCPGKINGQTGEISYGGSLPYLHGLSLKQYIEEHYQLPCCVLNDGKAAVLAELWLGNLRNIRNGAAIVLGTGVGGGIIVDGRLLNGSHFQAGELSFMVNSSDGADNYPLVGASLSAVKFVKQACRILGNTNEHDGRLVFAELEKKNPKILSLFEEYCRKIAGLVINLQAVLDSEKVVIGGGISSQPLLLKEVNKQYLKIRENNPLMKKTLSEIDIEACCFANKSNLLGAIYELVNEHHDR